MSVTLYADTAHVVEAIKQAAETTDIGEETRISVYDAEAVLRGATHEEVDERNLFGHLGDELCQFEYDGTRLEVSFHESKIESEFRLNPAGHDALPPTQQATNPKKLAPRVGEILRSIEREWDIICYDFAEVEAQSIGNGHLTDFSFTYVVTSTDI